MAVFKSLSATLLCVLFAIAAFESACAQQPAKDYTEKHLQIFFKQTVQQYKFELERELDLQLQPEPLLNPANQTEIPLRGSIFVWTEAGRPAVLANIFTFQVGDRIMYRHAVNSLLETPIRASLNGREVWTPEAAGLVWKDFAKISPSDLKVKRQTQFRALARTFRGDFTEVRKKKAELRLMPQPLFRYASETHDVIDGVIMAFSEQTTPVIFLLLEAYKGEDGSKRYRWAATPSHYVQLNLRQNGSVVWTSPENLQLARTREGQRPYSTRPYFTFFSRDPLPPAEALEKVAE